MILNTFQAQSRAPYATMDTETHHLLDGEDMPSAETLLEMILERDPKTGKRLRNSQWWREHITVTVWAYIVYTPEGLAILETWAETSRFLAQHAIKTVWWYNAPFDFAALDAAKMRDGWRYVIEDKKATPSPPTADRPEIAPKLTEPLTYSELASPFGARYTMTEIHPFDRSAAYSRTNRKTVKTRHYDARNLLRGGLGKNLETYKVTDADGNPIRKRTMNYQAAGADSLTEDDLLYMQDDARGLWYLIDAFGKQLADDYGIEIRGRKPQVLTASGLAKKLLLRKMYPTMRDDRARARLYRKLHPIDPELDHYLRDADLLHGGLVIVNPAIRGKPLQGIPIFRFDYNSHYPAIMASMPDIRGKPRIIEGRAAKDSEKDVRVFEITEIHAILRRGYVPSWLDPFTHGVADVIEMTPDDHKPIMMFDFELDELALWYDCRVEVSRTWLWKGAPCPAFADFVADHYARKAEASARHDKARKETEKTILNGCTGKFSQNPARRIQWRQMGEDGVVRLMQAEIEIDEAAIMSVLQGSYITAMGRTLLRKSCRLIAQSAHKPVAAVILYTDTDSLHSTVPWRDTDPYALGALKCENETPIKDAIFIAPKTYAEIDEEALALIGYVARKEYDGDGVNIRCKGVNVELLREAWNHGEPLAEIYRIGREYPSLTALNVRGGKALLPLPKAVCRSLPDDLPDEEIYY